MQINRQKLQNLAYAGVMAGCGLGAGCAHSELGRASASPENIRVGLESPSHAPAQIPSVSPQAVQRESVVAEPLPSGSKGAWLPPREPPRRIETASEHVEVDTKDFEFPAGTLVLHFGDSFAGALGPALNREFAKSEVRGILRYETSSYITTWAWDRDVEREVANANPDLVLITLGANEVELINPAQRAPAIRRLVSQLRGRPCAWIAPPLWEQDSGLMQVVHDNCAPCAFLDSTAQVSDLPRKKDGIHPSKPGQEVWAKVVLEWLSKRRSPTPGRPWNLLTGY
ncbi:MAG: SGNH/GDSL hydrolase family protein [Polyangiaceae bacterium]|nr:SGNH/GDSL hydrolase family protein [Polyangiaceae bacterium]